MGPTPRSRPGWRGAATGTATGAPGTALAGAPAEAPAGAPPGKPAHKGACTGTDGRACLLPRRGGGPAEIDGGPGGEGRFTGAPPSVQRPDGSRRSSRTSCGPRPSPEVFLTASPTASPTANPVASRLPGTLAGARDGPSDEGNGGADRFTSAPPSYAPMARRTRSRTKLAATPAAPAAPAGWRRGTGRRRDLAMCTPAHAGPARCRLRAASAASVMACACNPVTNRRARSMWSIVYLGP